MGEVNAQLPTEELSTLSSKHESEDVKQKMIKKNLKRLHEAGTFSDISDPVEWQREPHTDNSLQIKLSSTLQISRWHKADKSSGSIV